ncbi:MAG: hypothetical protein ACI4LI_09500, partial [Candidatus Fimenecus sp.]
MLFHEKLNQYMVTLDCSAKEVSAVSGLSAATLSRYRSGERVPSIHSESFENLCDAIVTLAKQKQKDMTKASVVAAFQACDDMITADRELLRQNFNALIAVLNMNITKLCRYTNYDVSTVFRIRNGTRKPADPVQFAAAVAGYVSREMASTADKAVLAKLLDCPAEALSDSAQCCEKLQNWLLAGKSRPQDDISKFLTKLNT